MQHFNHSSRTGLQVQRKSAKGMAMILTAMTTIVGLMVSSIAVDIGMAYAEEAHLQSAADSAALAAVQELAHSSGASGSAVRADARTQAAALIAQYSSEGNPVAINPNTDIQFGYIDPQNASYNANTFTTPTNNSNYSHSGGYNAVRIIVRRTDGSPAGAFPTLMAQLFGVDEMGIQADAVALMDNSITQVNGGLRPLYGCMAQYQAAMATGNPERQVARLYGDHHSLNGRQVNGCEDFPSGNWGFADLRDSAPGAPGNNTLGDWFEFGFSSNPVLVGETYSTQPGNSISSNNVKTALQRLIDNQTVINIPLIDWDEASPNNCGGKGKSKSKGKSGNGSGSNTDFTIGGFSGFVITGMKTNGSQSSRYIEGYFTNAICTGSNCQSGGGNDIGPGANLYKIRLLS